MATPLKIKFRKFMSELKCPHISYSKETKHCGFQSFVVCECNKCGKVWIE